MHSAAPSLSVVDWCTAVDDWALRFVRPSAEQDDPKYVREATKNLRTAIAVRTNELMRDILDQCGEDVLRAWLPRRTRKVLRAGWRVSPEGVLLLDRTWPKSMRMSRISSDDIGGSEYEFNDVRPPYSDIPVERNVFLPRVTARGLTFAVQAMRLAWSLPGSESMLALVNTGIRDDYLNQGVKIRIFTQRPGYPDWIHESLDRAPYEALAVLERDDIENLPD